MIFRGVLRRTSDGGYATHFQNGMVRKWITLHLSPNQEKPGYVSEVDTWSLMESSGDPSSVKYWNEFSKTVYDLLMSGF